MISGIALLAVQLVATVVFMVILSKVRIVPKDYVIMIDVLLVLILTVVTITQRWVLPGIITKIISLLLSVVLIVGSVYLNVTYGAFKKLPILIIPPHVLMYMSGQTANTRNLKMLNQKNSV